MRTDTHNQNFNDPFSPFGGNFNDNFKDDLRDTSVRGDLSARPVRVAMTRDGRPCYIPDQTEGSDRPQGLVDALLGLFRRGGDTAVGRSLRRGVIAAALAAAGAWMLSSCGGLMSVSGSVGVSNGPIGVTVGGPLYTGPYYTGPYYTGPLYNGPYYNGWNNGPCWGGPLWAGGGVSPAPQWNNPSPRPHWQPQQPNGGSLNIGGNGTPGIGINPSTMQPEIPPHRPSIPLQQFDNGGGLPGPAIDPGATRAV